jgi:uncharacterized membrane protein
MKDTMNIALWIVAGLLAALYLPIGVMKATQPKEKLRANLPWVEDFSGTQVRLIGVAEALGALGLLLPQATGIIPVLTPIAAVGLVVVQVGAIMTHVRRGEQKSLPMNVTLLVLAAFIAIGRLAS